jgi:hypothetical protein
MLMLLLLGGIGHVESAIAGDADAVGTAVVNGMRIELYLKAPIADLANTSGEPTSMNGLPTHHFQANIFDVETGNFIPYLNVLLHFKNLSNNQMSMISLPPMLGSWFHYGSNGALIEKGRYEVTVYVNLQNLMRYGAAEKKWGKSTTVRFNYDWED